MSKRILISPNSFKECADSVTIAEQIKDILSPLRNAELIIKPISDGGDGFLKVCQYYFDGEIRKYSISTAYDDSMFECPILYCEERKEIYIESAEVLGLKRVPTFYRNPLKLTSKGLGELLQKIEGDIQRKLLSVQKLYVGIGGTATIEMGLGMMSELGLRFLDSTKGEINVLPVNFQSVQAIEYKPFNFSFEIIPVVDVNSPLLGKQGGVSLFGKQKGADDNTILFHENGFDHMLKVFKNNGLQFSYYELSGAGGGIPAVFQIFYNLPLLYSSEFVEYHLGFHKYFSCEAVDYLITGEGAYDSQSEFGKAVGVLIRLFGSNVEQIFLVCGKLNIDNIAALPKYIIPIELSKYFDDKEESIIKYKEGLKKACKEIVNHLNF